ncbi:MAG: hypothetical protein WD648_14395, partial [Planctomycetaceae bacterium]
MSLNLMNTVKFETRSRILSICLALGLAVAGTGLFLSDNTASAAEPATVAATNGAADIPMGFGAGSNGDFT